MTAVKKKLLIALVCVAMLFAGIAIFSACNGDSDDLKVTFMVQDDATGQWQQYAEADVVDGSVTVPDAPDKDYYTFRNWFLNAEGTGDPFTGSDITESISVYAIYVADQATIYIDGQSQGKQNIVDVVDGTYAPERDNLVFDGWYTDANYQVSFTAGTETENLYGRYLAEITFDNGHEVVYTTRVTPGVNMTEPSSSDIVQWYMDPNNIYYQDEEGNALDFSAGVSFDENTTVTVLWCTPLDYELNSATSNYTVGEIDQDVIDYYSLREVPALSFLSSVRYDTDGDGDLETITVETIVDAGIQFNQLMSVETVLVNEGIVSINESFNSGNENLKKIVFPGSLKTIEDSFNGSKSNLNEIVLPTGLEVIINSFHGSDPYTPDDFDIEIPSTVINLSMAPSNFVFSNNNRFVNEEGVIYKVDDARGDILISAYPLVEDGILYVPERAVGIQRGAFSYGTYTEPNIIGLYIYDTWQFVNPNEARDKYPTHTGSTALFNGTNYGAIYNNSDGIVIIYSNSLPNDTSVTQGLTFQGVSSSNIHLLGIVDDGEEITVEVNLHNFMTNEDSTSTSFTITAGDTLTQEKLISSVEALNNLGDKLFMRNVKQFGLDYEFTNEPININLYLDVYYGYNVTGFTYELNTSDRTATVTGFDADTAYRFSDDANDYLVYIPETITVNGTVYTITAIADNAFNVDNAATNGNYNNVTHITISSTVKTIGEKAFYNASNLVYVYIVPGGLEVIGESAFENTGITSIALPVANLAEVGPYAFKTQTLTTFERAEGEEDRFLFTVDSRISTLYEGIKEGMFFLYNGTLVQYVGSSVEQQPTSSEDNTPVDIKVYDVRLIAIPGGMRPDYIGGSSYAFRLGASNRRSSFSGSSDSVVRYEVMEGSVYYLNNADGIVFGIISKIHENAFTDISEKASSNIYYYLASTTTVYESWVTQDQISAIASADYDFAAEDAIFEDGWWDGISVESVDYEETMAFMSKPGLHYYYIYNVWETNT